MRPPISSSSSSGTGSTSRAAGSAAISCATGSACRSSAESRSCTGSRSSSSAVPGSILWGVYSYRLHNLPTFVPPAHGLVFMAGLSLSQALRRHARALVLVAASIAAVWGVLGLTLLPRVDAAGALGVPLLLAFLWRSRARAAYAGVFLVVAGLELYGTAIGTWRWAETLPGLGIADGNPPRGVASGYVWFDVMALLLAPRLLAALSRGRPFQTPLPDTA